MVLEKLGILWKKINGKTKRKTKYFQETIQLKIRNIWPKNQSEKT